MDFSYSAIVVEELARAGATGPLFYLHSDIVAPYLLHYGSEMAALTIGIADAGGLLLYEISTADVGLASAGYTARAQDAATVFTNPAGMTRLEGDQLTVGLQALYGNASFSVDPSGTSPGLGNSGGGNAIGWFPGGGFFYSHSISPDLKVGMALTGNFGLSIKYNDGWAGRYRTQESTLIGVPSCRPWPIASMTSCPSATPSMPCAAPSKPSSASTTPSARTACFCC